MVLRFRDVVLYLFVGFVSCQFHEFGHWLAAVFFQGRMVMGFDRWYLSGLQGPLWMVLAAGPFVSLFLSVLGLILFVRCRGDGVVGRAGFFLAFFNPLFDLLSVVVDVIRGDFGSLCLNFCVCEFAWKAVLAPFFVLVFVLAVYYLSRFSGGRGLVSVVLGLFVLTVVVGLVVRVLDLWVWGGFEGGVFGLVCGFIAPVIVVDVVVFSVFVVLLVYFSRMKVAVGRE